jgi:hypothetical protein
MRTTRNNKRRREADGIEFEKLVSRIQQQLDPNAQVSHNELLTDRLGHKRQFDVVIRGTLAGHKMLGVIECKDLKRNVGVNDIEAFATKSRDVNANLKVFVSRRGFTKTAIEKAKDYGIQTQSLFPQDASEPPVIGTKWYADVYYWKQIAIQLHFVTEPKIAIRFAAEDVAINGKRVIDWFKNYLITNHRDEMREGWVVNGHIHFKTTQKVSINADEYECSGLSFSALRACEHKMNTVGWSGTGFYDWQSRQPSLPPRTTLTTRHQCLLVRTLQGHGEKLRIRTGRDRPRGPLRTSAPHTSLGAYL